VKIQQRLVETAPPEILSELSRARIKLAEQERINRTLKRHAEDAHTRHLQLLGEIESLQKKVSSAGTLTSERDAAVHDLNVALAELTAWKEFGRDANLWMKRTSTSPPEVSSVRRFLETAQVSVENCSKKNELLSTRCEELQQKLTTEQQKSRRLGDAVHDQKPKEADWESRLAAVQEQWKAAVRQSELYQRENESLQTLMQTFELQMDKKRSKEGGDQQLDPSLQTLRIQLEAAEGRCKEWQTSHETLTMDLADIKKSEDALKDELERVKEKFGKLREALTAEREKVTDAEARVVVAEQLAANGSFNPSMTRVLHFTETPMEATLKEEVAVLKRQLEAKAVSTGRAGVEPGKLHERLQQTFKEQIALYRDGVHLITGFKIDMLNYGSEQPKFRLRSMFAEHEDDDLMLQWPRAKQGKAEAVERLNLLSTDFAKSLTRTPPYDYMTKYNSMPAFTASLQLSLFEKQTMMM
jgi:DNA repair exonuclease SbcCD ATPase subunit